MLCITVSCIFHRFFRQTIEIDDFSCCADLLAAEAAAKETKKSRFNNACSLFWRKIAKFFGKLRKHIKNIVDHKYFQQGKFLLILLSYLSLSVRLEDVGTDVKNILGPYSMETGI